MPLNCELGGAGNLKKALTAKTDLLGYHAHTLRFRCVPITEAEEDQIEERRCALGPPGRFL